jgi:chaperonin GroEL (HSP60 family)
LDPELKDEATIRNYIEHRYLKVVDFSNGGSNIEHSSNGISYSVSKENFEKLTLYLMKKVREAIILLTIMVKFEEENKGNDDNLPIIEGIKIDDEFK